MYMYFQFFKSSVYNMLSHWDQFSYNKTGKRGSKHEIISMFSFLSEMLFYEFLQFYEDFHFNTRLSVNKGSKVGRVYNVESLQMMYPFVSSRNIFKAVNSNSFCDQLRSRCKETVKKVGSIAPNTRMPWGLCLLFEWIKLFDIQTIDAIYACDFHEVDSIWPHSS